MFGPLPPRRFSMRLLTYNIHKGIGGQDRRYRLDRIIDVIEQENPDVICLQEVDRHVKRSHFHDQPKLLAHHFHSVGQLYQMNVHLKDGGYGNLILSRWPFKSHHQISLTYRDHKARGAQIVVIESEEGPFLLVNWHLGLAEKMRQWQVRHLLAHPLFKEAADLPTLIVGDFNDWRNTLADRVFSGNDFQQVTIPPSRFRSFPASFPLGALDKAFIRGELRIRHAHVVKTPVSRKASDHLPLEIDFHLGPFPRRASSPATLISHWVKFSILVWHAGCRDYLFDTLNIPRLKFGLTGQFRSQPTPEIEPY
jgi:endonuclease/exonuclease/phosphatase family metal-dependent hydrolase